MELKRKQTRIKNDTAYQEFIAENQISKIVYTIQQSIGCIGDAFDNSNQSRKRIGQLFENLIKLVIKEIGIECEPRRILLPVIGFDGYSMSYELDLVFSQDKAILTSETVHIHPHEVVGSVKTTSKDRIDKIFLDSFCFPNYSAEILNSLLFSFTMSNVPLSAKVCLVSILPLKQTIS